MPIKVFAYARLSAWPTCLSGAVRHACLETAQNWLVSVIIHSLVPYATNVWLRALLGVGRCMPVVFSGCRNELERYLGSLLSRLFFRQQMSLWQRRRSTRPLLRSWNKLLQNSLEIRAPRALPFAPPSQPLFIISFSRFVAFIYLPPSTHLSAHIYAFFPFRRFVSSSCICRIKKV